MLGILSLNIYNNYSCCFSLTSVKKDCFTVLCAWLTASCYFLLTAASVPPSLRDLYSRSSLSSPSGASATSPASPLDLTRYSLPSLRQYELAQQMVSQQGAVSKLLGECLWSGGARSQVVQPPYLCPR